jgi:hypothetical protein
LSAPRGPSLPEKVVALATALSDIPHAFGGALALAYHAEPRATVDIDLNLFVPASMVHDVLTPLATLGVETGDAAATIARDGQARVHWGHTPIDLFFAYDSFHEAARRAAITVPFAEGSINILSAAHLCVCKVIFNRPKDWVDIDSIRALGTPVDTAEVLRWVGRIAGDSDPRYNRIATVLTT